VLLLSSTGFEVPEGARSVLIVYGIPSCDTVRAACKWLQGRGIAFDLHDVRKDHLDSRTLEHWLDTLGRDRLINKSSATWRTLDISQREQVERGNPVPVIIANAHAQTRAGRRADPACWLQRAGLRAPVRHFLRLHHAAHAPRLRAGHGHPQCSGRLAGSPVSATIG
jgi:arsenate reductase-like glutaredoxin family protein